MSTSDEKVEAVLKALENVNYKWRTISGMSKETGLSAEEVLEVLRSSSGKIVKRSVPSAEGGDQFTTREHFRKKANALQKVLGAIKNRAV